MWHIILKSYQNSYIMENILLDSIYKVDSKGVYNAGDNWSQGDELGGQQIELSMDTLTRLRNMMRALDILDPDEFINEMLHQMEVRGRRRRSDAMDVVDRVFTVKCPRLDRFVGYPEGEECEFASEFDRETGSARCAFCGFREVRFLTSCPALKKEASLSECVECKYGIVDSQRGTVVCTFIEK
jgi:hypothetical protein